MMDVVPIQQSDEHGWRGITRRNCELVLFGEFVGRFPVYIELGWCPESPGII